ncbi:MAG: hypothetical protein U5R06_03725 [candidate division KSB1 bacterium]|nr:hypothetical protein [candidate division KSB1 bacterium]
MNHDGDKAISGVRLVRFVRCDSRMFGYKNDWRFSFILGVSSIHAVKP